MELIFMTLGDTPMPTCAATGVAIHITNNKQNSAGRYFPALLLRFISNSTPFFLDYAHAVTRVTEL